MGKGKTCGLKYVCLVFSVLAVLGLLVPVLWSFVSEDVSISDWSSLVWIGLLAGVCIVLAILTLFLGPKHHVLSVFLLLILTLVILGIILLCLYLALILWAFIDGIYVLLPVIPVVTSAIWIILFWVMFFKCYR